MPAIELLQTYAQRIRELRRANADVPETGLAPAFQQLLDGLVDLCPLAPRLTVVPEYRNAGIGRPDIALITQGQPPRAFVELKAPNKPADPARWRQQDKAQFERFKELAWWAPCNFSEIRLFHRDDEQEIATIVPEQWLRPDKTDARANAAIAGLDPGPLLRLIEQLCISGGQPPRARDAAHLAELLAYSARLVRGIVRDRLAELRGPENERHPLAQVRDEFRNVLYAHPEAGGYSAKDFEDLFSAAFAQTLAFGLLLVRESRNEPVGSDAWEHMPEEHPLMRTALRVLTQQEVVRDIGVGFDVMCDTVNSFSPDILAVTPGGRDPILYFYEDFLETFDPDARERYGVYYTPLEVVRYMAAAMDRALRDSLHTEGLVDPAVTILDPATGTGTFLLGVAEHVRKQAGAAGRGMGALALHDLARRMFGFELLVGPYAVAHYRLHHTLSRREDGEEGEDLRLPRLGVYLADTLAEPGAAAPAGQLGFVSEGIADERREANRIKTQQPILAIIGNPPYRRLEEGENRTLVGRWMDELWDDLKEPVRAAGKGNQLNTFPELSTAFWRWAIWKLFEAENAPRRGVVAFITNRKFLTGWPYAGLRKMMRERFDRIEIIDLRGDVRTGERADVNADQGVFNIMVGTAVTVAIADGSKAEGALADVLYEDCWTQGLFSRRAKLDWLIAQSESGAPFGGVPVVRSALDAMRPQPFQNGDWLSLAECFSFRRSGIQTKRDEFVYSPSREELEARIHAFHDRGGADSRTRFSPTTARPYEVAQVQQYRRECLNLVAYRPLDLRWLYNHSAFIDRPRPELQHVWGNDNVGFYAMGSGTASGPAVWCHGLLPDYHAFRNRGGYAFPLYDRRPDKNRPNISAQLIQSLSATYGQPTSAENIFDAILCLLSARSYTLWFAEDLEDVFPHVPFPADPEVFAEAVRIGREIRAVETFARAPGAAWLTPDLARVESQPRGNLASVDYDDGAIVLCEDGSGRVTGIPETIWTFAVSGYRLLPRWLEGRAGLPVDFALVSELRDICGRIAELIDLFAQADTVLDATLEATLSREALGFAPAAAQVEDDGRD